MYVTGLVCWPPPGRCDDGGGDLPPLPVLCMVIARPAAAATSEPTRPTTLDQPIGLSLDFSLSSAVGARMGMPRQPPPKPKPMSQ